MLRFVSENLVEHMMNPYNLSGLIIGGGTNALDKKGEIDYYSEPVPTTHIHFYNFNTNIWISSTDNTSTVCFTKLD